MTIDVLLLTRQRNQHDHRKGVQWRRSQQSDYIGTPLRYHSSAPGGNLLHPLCPDSHYRHRTPRLPRCILRYYTETGPAEGV